MLQITQESTNQEIIDWLKTNTKLIDVRGKLSASCSNEAWFSKRNMSHILVRILEETKAIEDQPIARRIWAFFHLPIPFCPVCGKPNHKDSSTKWTTYCSQKCALNDPDYGKKISAGCKKRTPEHQKRINEKREATMNEKYGYCYNGQRPNVKKILRKKSLDRAHPKILIERLLDKNWLNEHYNKQKKTGTDIALELSKEFGFYVDYATVLSFCRHHGFKIRQRHLHSAYEKAIIDFIRNDIGLTDDNIGPNKKMLGGERSNLEIDVYVPEKNVGIELNGLRWHSHVDVDPEKESRKHLQKSLLAKEKGIRLFHFTDKQWDVQGDIVRSMIRNALGATPNRIHARKCTVHVALTKEEKLQCRLFLDSNHIQGGGKVSSSIYFYLKHQDQIVSVMTFGKPRFSKGQEWELIRFAILIDHNVIGGFSKLFSHFISTYNPSSIVSYADFMYSNGNVYEKNGFEFDHRSNPGYYWTTGKCDLISRYRTQKHKLKNLLGEKNFDPSLSESQNMLKNGYRKFWDCGQLVYVWNKK